ncbi:TPA: transposase [Escherichia coli]|nr:transposase [Escherichia coli]HAP2421857.1 transposase [Escherichia coli]
MAHQIFRSSCSITPLAVPRRCRSASWRQKGVERIGCWACAAQVHQKTQSKGKIGRAEMALTLINKLYGIERDMEEAGDAQRYQTRQSQSQAFLEQLKARLDKTPPQVTSSKCLGQAINCLASNWLKLIRYIERGTPAHRQQPCRATFSCTYDQSVARLLPLCHAYPRRSIDGLCAPEHSFPEGRLGTYLHVLSRRSCV